MDQFSKTISGTQDTLGEKSDPHVKPVSETEGKRVERGKSAPDKEKEHKERLFSELILPGPDIWSILIEAVTRFNGYKDIRHSPYTIRLWAQNNGLRIQLIRKESGELIKQTKLILFKDITEKILEEMIDALIRERGIVIDLLR